MAEHVVGSMVGLAHSFSKLFKDQNNRKWDVEQWNSKIVELKGSNVCIYGYGELGKSIAKKLKAFEMNIYACLLYTSPSPRDKRQSRMPSSA